MPVAITEGPPAIEITPLKGTLYKVTARELKEKVEALGKGAVKYVINTHAHVDHTGGNGVFGKNAVVIAHGVLREQLQKGRYIIEDYPDDALPDITFEDDLTLHFNGEDIRIAALPGSHSASDIIVVLEGSGVAYLGDLAYGGKFPSVDLRRGDATRYAEVARKAIEYLPPGITIVSGHGDNSSREEFVEFQHMLEETTAIVRKGLADGKTVTEMQDEKVLEDWESHGDLYVTADEWIEDLVFSARRGGPKASLIEPLYHSYLDEGIDGAVRTYLELKKSGRDEYLFHRFVLVLFGNWLLKNGKLDDAVRMLETNIKEYPEFAYNHELLGGIYMKMGKHEKAIRSLQRSLELDPENEVATEMIKRMGEEK